MNTTSTALTFATPDDDRLGLPIAPGRLPVIGHSLHLTFWMESFLKTLREMDEELVWVNSAPGSWVVEVKDPSHFDLLRSKAGSNAHYFQLAQVLLGHSLLTRDGKEHRTQRNAMNSPFTPKGLSALGTSAVMKETVLERIGELLQKPEFVGLVETRELALDIIFRILGIDRAELPAWREQYEEVLLSTFPIKWDLPGSPHRRASRGRAWVSERVRARVEELRQDTEAEGLLAEMVRGWDAQEERGEDEILVDNVLLLALAGHETTASTMAWMLCHLAQDPELFDRAMAEAKAGGEVPGSPKELGNFPLIEGIFRECLRLYPPVPAVSRLLTEPVEVGDKLIPAGVQLSFPIILWQRDPRRFEDPDAFKPERWVGMDRKPQPIDNIGFSFGPHFCLGYHVAWMEAVQFGVALMLGLAESGKRLELVKGFPKVETLGLLHPKKAMTRVRLVAG
ncbi:MAG: cytochrome P450 [Alphaproteobacteria bacterium]|nr:cytochrome P450 [Alphaproteobacteria bacterium]MCB9792813.1 cytochrome P450 [Alphaproteobacteria bacterium]